MKIELLVDSDEFWPRLRNDMDAARTRVYLQTMSFEGDRVGEALGGALEACQAKDRRFLVDSYSLLYHSDRLIPGPAWARPSLRAELRSTRRWVRRLQDSGVGVRFCNPLAAHPITLLARNHKKLVVVDDHVSYVGGINFSEHNFDWHDAMLRVESRELGAHLARDFESSWTGTSRPSDRRIGRLRVLALNGEQNPRNFQPLLDLIDGAVSSIEVISAYLSPPFSDHLAHAAGRGVRVRVLTPERNNKVHLAAFIREAARRHGFHLSAYRGRMNHTKAMIVDDRTLVLGSCNFDLASFYLMDELFVISEDADLLRQFRARIWDPDMSVAMLLQPRPSLPALLGHQFVRAVSLAIQRHSLRRHPD